MNFLFKIWFYEDSIQRRWFLEWHLRGIFNFLFNIHIYYKKIWNFFIFEDFDPGDKDFKPLESLTGPSPYRPLAFLEINSLGNLIVSLYENMKDFIILNRSDTKNRHLALGPSKKVENIFGIGQGFKLFFGASVSKAARNRRRKQR